MGIRSRSYLSTNIDLLKMIGENPITKNSIRTITKKGDIEKMQFFQ